MIPQYYITHLQSRSMAQSPRSSVFCLGADQKTHGLWERDCTIFASLANERVHGHKERNFPQAKLDSDIDAGFLLNEHSDLYFFIA